MKVNSVISQHKEQEPVTYEVLHSLCRDFFEAGIIIGENASPANNVVPVGCGTAAAPQIEDTDFAFFWQSYDKKVGKDKCIRLWRKLSKQEKMICMQYVPLYKQAQPDKQFRKNPETFLRNKSWQDEIIIRNNEEQHRLQRLKQAAEVIAGYENQGR